MVNNKFTRKPQFIEYWAAKDASKRKMADEVGQMIADMIVEEDSFTPHGDDIHLIVGVLMKDKTGYEPGELKARIAAGRK